MDKVTTDPLLYPSYHTASKGETREGSWKVVGNVRPHQQCPRETEDNSHRFQTGFGVSIIGEVG